MKRSLLSLAIALTISAGVQAAPIGLPSGPLYIKFNNNEQLDATTLNNITVPGASVNIDGIAGGDTPEKEGNWGVFDIAEIAKGRSVTPHVTFNRDNANILWSNSGGEYTGIFYGIQLRTGTIADGGWLDLYYDANDDYDATSPGSRTAANAFTTATEGTLLVRLKFMPGAVAGDAAATLSSAADVQPGVFNNIVTTLYADVMDINGDGVITAADGVWAEQLNQDWFWVDINGNGTIGEQGINYTDANSKNYVGDERRDLFFTNRFNNDPTWDSNLNTAGCDVANGEICGAVSDDPVRAFAVPEPATVALLGLSLLGLGLFSRRRMSV